MERIFALSNLLVLPFWLSMILLPRWRWTERVMRSPLVAAPPALLYAVLVLPRLAEIVPVVIRPELGQIASLLATPEGAIIAWAHFLAFDLLVGRWIYLDGRGREVNVLLLAPILFLTLMLGPVGFLLYLAVRAAHSREKEA